MDRAAPIQESLPNKGVLCHPQGQPGCLARPWVGVGSPGDMGNFPSGMFGQKPIGFYLGVSSCCSNPIC